MSICPEELAVSDQARPLPYGSPTAGMACYHLNMDSFVMVFLRGEAANLWERENRGR